MTKVYKPSDADIKRLKPKTKMLKVSGDGVFATLQGEGVTAGLPSIFLRLHYCNLTCGLSSGWKCDTVYAWDRRIPEYWQEPEDWSYKKTTSAIKKAWNNKFGNGQKKRLVITGGEPLIQQKNIVKLLEQLPDWSVEIETNGTIMPIPNLRECQFNCSPKLENSGNSLDKRYKPRVLKMINGLPKSWFKFVVIYQSDLEEVDAIVKNCQLNPEKVLIMPEGRTSKEVKTKADRLKRAVENKGWKITMRNQLIWYGPKRRT